MSTDVVTMPVFGVGFSDEALEKSMRSRMADIEEALGAAVSSDFGLLSQASRHLIDAGGKRFRPLVTLLAAHFGDPMRDGVVESAVVVELTHLATLYHDDVMDEAPVRRGAPSANSRWTNTIAILTGDFLFARASSLLSELGPQAVRIQADTYARLVTGQIRETVGPDVDVDRIEHYLDVLADKTGSLIATSAQFGAMFAGAEADHVGALRRLGELIGVAFQLSDDILDIASESAQSGKTPGTDLREGIPTLPVLYALRDAAPDTARLRELLAGPVVDDDLHAEALALLRQSTALKQARETLDDYADKARAELDRLPDIPARAGFASVIEMVVDRTG